MENIVLRDPRDSACCLTNHLLLADRLLRKGLTQKSLVASQDLDRGRQHAARTAIRELLGWHGLQVCGDAKDGKEAVEKVVELKPDIVLMDINMPGMNGITAASEIRRLRPATKIVFLTVHDGPGFVAGTRPWAHGFVPKSAAGTELIPTLQRLAGNSQEVSTRSRPAATD